MIFLVILSIIGLIDSSYLSWEHFNSLIPPCTINNFLPIFSDCGKVLKSSYSIMFGIPLAFFGIVHYLILLIAIINFITSRKKLFAYWIILQSIIGAIFSFYLMYLQLIVIKSICIYCTLSAFVSFIILLIGYKILSREKSFLRLIIIAFIYQKIIKPVFFLFDAELIHNLHVSFGEFLGQTFFKKLIAWKFRSIDKSLKQKIVGITFENPIGLAAGFDYNAQLTQILPSLGFGFNSVGTVTNLPYEGNPKPRLGRLPKSKSLMVNKGFKNIGAQLIANKLKSLNFETPLGISIGVSNNKTITNLKEAIDDIKKSFIIFEKEIIKNSYYELNISCPNLVNLNLNFYKPEDLKKLLEKLRNLKLKKPLFVKMPIDKKNPEFLAILRTINQFSFVKGVIIGNLLKDRKNKLLNKDEVRKFKVGNFSGKPCEKRANELIKLTFSKYGKRFVIIGCGGVFSTEDVCEKIKLGASLVQLITGIVYQGPQLISQINLELAEKLKKNKLRNISLAIGTNK